MAASNSASSRPHLTASSTSPAVLDSPIKFTATLKDYDVDSDQTLVFKFIDTVSPGHFEEVEVRGRNEAELRLSYESDVYRPGNYSMQVTKSTSVHYSMPIYRVSHGVP